MKGMLSGAAALGILTTAYAIAPASLPAPEAAAPAADGSRYRLHFAGIETSCLVDRGRDIGDGTAELTIAGDCLATIPEISAAKFWRDNADGSVVFAGAGGRAVLEFALSDGPGYETFRPGAPLASLSVADN